VHLPHERSSGQGHINTLSHISYDSSSPAGALWAYANENDRTKECVSYNSVILNENEKSRFENIRQSSAS
jgi:hypothetical protein